MTDDNEEAPNFYCVAPINTSILADAFAVVQNLGDEVESVVFHPIDFADVLKLGGPDLLSAGLLPEELSQMQATGLYPSRLWRAVLVRDGGAERGIVLVQGAEATATIKVIR